MGIDTDNRNTMIGLAVLETKVDNLEEKADERHQAVLAALAEIQAALPPLRTRVEALEKLKTQAYAIAGALTALGSAIAWLAGVLGR